MASPQIAPMKIGVGAANLQRLVPIERVRACDGPPMKLHERGLALLIDEPERVDAKALHHAQAARQRPIGHRPHQHVRRLGHQRNEIPKRIVRRRGLRHREMRLRFRRMDQIRKLHRVLNEENRDVVADEVPVPFVGVELHGEARTSRGVSGEPRSPMTVENRVNTGVRWPALANSEARVTCFMGL